MNTTTSYLWYDTAGRQYGLPKAKVIAAVNKYKIPKRRIYGQMAVDETAWRSIMAEMGYNELNAP